ncbi:MAG TPA: asparagine synthase-related protein [Thermoanaerobaculia bacterium]
MTHHAWYRRQACFALEGRVALGGVSLGDRWDASGPGLAARDGGAAFLDGEIYGTSSEQARRRLLDSCAAESLLEPWLGSLHGLFSAAVWDAARRRLLLVSDRFGMKPLFYCHGPGRFLFASEIKALLAEPTVPRAPDLQGLVSLFRYGQLLGGHTLFESVRVLPPGAVLEYEPASDRLSERRYYRPSLRAPEPGLPDSEHVARLGELFKAAVDRRLTSGAQMGLSLSGGLDSRTILAVVDERRFPFTTLCLGIPGSIDQKAARRMAALTGSRHCDFLLDQTFLGRFEEHLRRLVWLTDGHFRSDAVTVTTLDRYRELGVEILLRGHAGELLHMAKAYDYSVDPQLLAVRDEAGLEDWLTRRVGGWMLAGVQGPLFRGISREETDGRALALLRDALSGSRGGEPLSHRVWHLFLRQKLRRHTAMSLLEYGSLLRVRLPYLDNDLVEAVLSTPPGLKLGDRVQAHILARYRPSFLRIVNANTGTWIGAGPRRRQLARFRHRVLAKLRVPGHQPYERLGLWLRRELRPIVARILLDDRFLDRGIFDPDTVRRTVSAHLEHRANHTHLLMTMMIFELGRRMILGEETGGGVETDAGQRAVVV